MGHAALQVQHNVDSSFTLVLGERKACVEERTHRRKFFDTGFLRQANGRAERSAFGMNRKRSSHLRRTGSTFAEVQVAVPSRSLVAHQDNGAERRNRGSLQSSRKFGASWALDALTARVASEPVPLTVICGHRRTTRRRASSASEPAERAVHFASCEAHTLLIEAGSQNHEEQASTRCRAVVSTPDNVERC